MFILLFEFILNYIYHIFNQYFLNFCTWKKGYFEFLIEINTFIIEKNLKDNFVFTDQPKRSPMSIPYSSYFGGYSFFGGAFLSSFLGYSFLAYLGASFLAAGASAAPVEAPPKLKKLDKLCPVRALANIFGQ